MSVKDHVEEIKKAFLAQYNHFIEEKKEEYQAENPDTTEDFQYQFPLKVKFDQSYSIYKDNKIYISKFTNKFEIEFRKQISYCRRIKRANQSTRKHQRHLKTF
jgi:hypothetical protein